MFPVAIFAAGWLFLFIVLLAVPDRRTPRPAASDDAAPAVVSLLAGTVDKLGFGATLVDLAVRGWFRVIPPAGLAGPAMCVVPAEAPAGTLAPFERRVVAHVALRAGARGEVPAPALSDGYEGGETDFLKAFRDEVEADARQRGLTRSRLSGRRAGLLCLLLFAPAAVLLVSVHKHGLAYAGVFWFAGCWVTLGVAASRRRSAAGQSVLDRWRAAAAAAPGGAADLAASGGAADLAASGGGRTVAYAAALGAAPAALAVFAPAGTNTAWSSYRGGWQQLEIETTTWPWRRACVILLAIMVFPFVYVGGAIWLGTHGMAGLAEEMVGLVVAGAVVGVGVWAARRTLFPRSAEFDGQVIRQWIVKGDSESPDQYHVAIDDGTREVAWDLSIGSEPYRLLPPGTFVHARVNLRNRDDVTVQPVEPPTVARPLAAIADEQQRAATGGLPDPAGLMTEAEAAAVLGGPVRGTHADGPAGRTMMWQPARTTMPILRVLVRQASGGRPVPPAARPVPGVADGYLLGQGAMLTVTPLAVVVSISGRAPAGAEGMLAGLLPQVEERLRRQVARLAGGSPLLLILINIDPS